VWEIAMTKPYSKGVQVTWAWGAHEAHGEIEDIFTRRVQRTLKGAKVVRKGTPDEPAYVVRQSDGDRALKSHSELSRP
jgi:hypothetical protein